MESEQFNIRMSRELICDLNTISALLKVNKSEWVKTTLARAVHEEKNKLLLELSTLYSNGMISKKEVGILVGKKIADEVEFIKKKAVESARDGAKYGKKLRERNVRV